MVLRCIVFLKAGIRSIKKILCHHVQDARRAGNCYDVKNQRQIRNACGLAEKQIIQRFCCYAICYVICYTYNSSTTQHLVYLTLQNHNIW